jgi:hypothetical protein
MNPDRAAYLLFSASNPTCLNHPLRNDEHQSQAQATNSWLMEPQKGAGGVPPSTNKIPDVNVQP